MIQASEKPFIFVGGGAILSGASKELKEFVEKTDAPVTDSLMGKGAFPGTDPRYTGMLGMHGTKASNYGVSECDLLVVVGARFSDRVTGNTATFAKNAKILQIDIDPAEMNKNIIIDQGVVGDIKAVLRKLNEVLPQQDHAEWMKKIQDYKEKYPLKYHEGVLTGPFVVEEIYRQTKGDAIITTEVGQHQMWAAQYFKYTKPRTLLTSGGLGTMGYGLGAAIGAKTGCPDKTVINVAGDGCFRMNMNELATAVRHEVPVIEVVINNHVLGMVRQWQDLFYDERYSATVLRDAVDYVKLAEAMGAEGMRATTQEEFREAFAKALASGRPVLIDCMILSIVVTLILGSSVYIFGPELLHIYSNQADVIKYGMEIFSYTTVTYFLCGLMDLFPGALRGMGYSTVPMILSIIGTVGVRIIWIYGLFPSHRSLTFLFLSYPVSWIATIIMQVICFWFVRKKIHRTMAVTAE